MPQWSEYQQAVFEFGKNSNANGIIMAVAGSGKTTVIEELGRQLPDSTRICYLVFNRRNADEAKARMPANVTPSTFHSACMGPLQRRLGRVKVDGDKVRWILKTMQEEEGLLSEAEFWTFAKPVQRLVGLGKNTGLGIVGEPTEDDWVDLMENFGIEADAGRGGDQDKADARLVELAHMALERSNDQLWRIDFDDMLYLTVKLNVALPTYDVVCVDEAQDTNQIQRTILRRMVNGTGRMIAVGDPRQAIYGFRGATANAMQVIEDDFKCVVLPLSINYRCSSEVVKAAQPFCPQLEARPDAPIGSVESLEEMAIGEFGAGDAVLCRTTAPIVQLAMRLIANRTPVTVMGRDIGASLKELVGKLKKDGARTVGQFHEALESHYAKESDRVSHRRNAEVLLQALEDRCDSLRALAGSLDDDAPVERINDVIDSLFGDAVNDQKVTLATVHKSKGLEFPRVFILNRSEMPHKRAVLDWQVEQENNLIYVGYTRAKMDLRFIELANIG